MKEPGRKFTRIVNWTVSGNLLFASCHSDWPLDSSIEVDKSHNYALNICEGQVGFDLTLEDEAYLIYLSKLAERMMSDRLFAKKVAATPDIYPEANHFARYNFAPSRIEINN